MEFFSCGTREPGLCPTASELLRHPFVTGELEDVQHLNRAGSKDNAIHILPRHERTRKPALVEVFSVQLITTRVKQLDNFVGFILLRSSNKNYVLYQDSCDKTCPQHNSEGNFTLIGPECGVELHDSLILYPWFFYKSGCCDWCEGQILWKRDPCWHRTDQFIRKGIKRKIDIVEVHFAVYDDAVEARLDIALQDLELGGLLQLGESLEIFGTVKTSNSVIIASGARSTLFDRIIRQERIKLSSLLSGEAEIKVPLTRSVTVIPRKSDLLIDVDLSLFCNPQDKCLAVGSVTFDANSRSSCTIEERIIIGPCAKLKVRAIWTT